ncbi:MAG: helix-turn-helix domain-containing protein [Georgenia sp.]
MDSTQYAAAVADNVSGAIDTAGKSHLSLAQETGIPRTTLDRRLRSNGASAFSVSELKDIANVLGIKVASLTTVYEADADQPARAAS